MFLFDKYRSSRQQNVTGNNCSLRWKTFLPANPTFCAESTAVVDGNGNFYFGSHSGNFYSLDNMGNIRWSFYTKQKIYGSPLFSKDNVVFAAGDGWIYSLTKDNGNVSWMFDLKQGFYDNTKQKILQLLINLPFTLNLKRKMLMDTKCWSSPLLINGLIYITAFGRGIYCFDENGNEKWNMDLGFPRYQLSGAVADTNNNIYFASRQGYLYSCQLNGQLNWKKYIGNYNVWGNPSYNDFTNNIYVPLSKGENKGLIACYTNQGVLKWKTKLVSAIYGSIAIAPNRMKLYCADFAGFVYCINSANGKIETKKKISNATRALWTTPTFDSNGDVLISTKDGNSKKGRVIKMSHDFSSVWEFETGQALSIPLILDNGDVCVGSWDGNYYCIKTR